MGGEDVTGHNRVPTWRMGAARWAGRLAWPFDALAGLARLFQSGIPVGLLRREEIARVVWAAYRDAPDFYNPAHYQVRHEERVLPVLERHVRRGGGDRVRLLDLYCGHGREAEIFARAGYRVTGVDAQREVIDRARAYAGCAGFEAEFLVADVEQWQPVEAAWDVVYTSLWMYSTVPDRAERIAWTRRVSQWAAPHGVTVISVRPRAPGRGTAMRHVIARVTAALTRNSRRPELGDRFEHGLFWHDCSGEEVTAELRTAGVDVLETVEARGGMPCTFYVVRSGDDRI